MTQMIENDAFPKIKFDKRKKQISLRGNAYANAHDLENDLKYNFDQLENEYRLGKRGYSILLDLDIIDQPSFFVLYKMLVALRNKEHGLDVKIKWVSNGDDSGCLAKGYLFSKVVGPPFIFV